MATTISDQLESWPILEKSLPKKDRGLLIGNGASIALWPHFRYSSLYEMARSYFITAKMAENGQNLNRKQGYETTSKDITKTDHLTTREISVFSTLETQNFEAVLSAMITAGKVWNIFDKPTNDIEDLRDSYRRVRKSLIRAVKEIHVPFDRVTEKLKAHLRGVFGSYSYVYSTNYDLLLYWAMMHDRDQFKDFVWGRDSNNPRNLFDVSDTDLWDGDKPTTKVLFLHGALHLYKAADGRTFKKLSGEDGNLLDLFDVQGDAIPLLALPFLGVAPGKIGLNASHQLPDVGDTLAHLLGSPVDVQ